MNPVPGVSYLSGKPSSPSDDSTGQSSPYSTFSPPPISLPKGGGAIRSIDEKFRVNASNGTSGCSIPFPFSASRNEFVPAQTLEYNSGSGNGVFGMGWNATPASITRRTDKKLPEYNDATESDIFIFSGAENLVPVYNKDDSGNPVKDSHSSNGVTITRYRPRIDSGFLRIEKIEESDGNTYWKVTGGNNVVSVFGKSKSSQLYDPANPSRIFKWLLEFSYDDKGNCLQYEYKKEDKINIPGQLHEKNRLNDLALFTNIYLKRIKYCNKVHFSRSSIDPANWESFLNGIEYLLEMVLDYGEHDTDNPQPDDDKGWLCRADAFSDYRAGFEIRTYRLCRRLLMFHHFSELGVTACLVNSMDMEYDAGADLSFLSSVTQKGYIRKTDGSYSMMSLPKTVFSYQELGWDTTVRSLSSASAENFPVGIDDKNYQWVDLYKEGISGILTEQAGAWHYKSNAGGGEFEGVRTISLKPSMGCICAGTTHFSDIDANGQQFLVSDDLNGYFELTDDNEWLPFKNFTDVPRVNLHDPNLRMLDLNGDGMADILISEHSVFTWYASKGKEGYESYKKLSKVFDEETGPNMVFSDSTESIVLADMNGDGLFDIVRIRYCEVAYWPNLGYGRFGAKVNMNNAPVFDNAENFNPRYIKLADIDGSGTTDIVYLGHDSFKIYFNQSGNGWSEANVINGTNPIPFPSINEYTNVSIVDLLGNGTGSIVWSSLLSYPGQSLQYIDLMGGKKPYVMTGYINNMGKEVSIAYQPSTFYYLQDKKAGTPWITKLPFPVQCVSEVVLTDQTRKSRFTTQYSYHHGYYDHFESEFRGFGRIEQTDTEDFENFQKLSEPGGPSQIVDEGFHQPPILTKTWYHTGAFLDKEKVLGQFSHEYYQNAVIPENALTEPPLPAGLTIDEWREGLRACKGLLLRSEVYSKDGSDKEEHPYSTEQHSVLVQLSQPRLTNPYAVLMAQSLESLTYVYDRNPADPRIEHGMTIETDEFGNVLLAASIHYGRKTTDASLSLTEQAEQGKTHIVVSQNKFTNKIDEQTDYRLPLGYDTSTFELTIPDTGNYFSIGDIRDAFDQSDLIGYEASPTAGLKQRRLIKQIRTVLSKDDMSGPLAPGVMEPMALPYQSYKLSMTPALRDFIFGDKVSDELLLNEGKYVHLDDGNYWIASSLQTLDAGNFYQMTTTTDAFGFTASAQYDEKYRIFIQDTTDALDNHFSVLGFDYRTLSPYLMVDLNGNRAGVRMDEMGMVVSTFSMGKEGENKGDLMDTSSVVASATDQPGTIMEYDLFNYQNTGKPIFIKSTVYETHYWDSTPAGTRGKSIISYAYADGLGQEIMKKMQAEPGIALQENPDGTTTEVDTTPNLRWIGNGRTVFNNKGKAVKQYEPYFSTTFEFEESKLLVERGITPLITYDPTGRVIRTDLPNGTFSQAEFGPWKQTSSDLNDTVLESGWYKDRITDPVAAIATPEEVAAANKAAAHAKTPAVAYLDSLGRSFLSIADNGSAGKYKTITDTDIEGNVRSITDARGNVVMQYKFDMLGAQFYRSGNDAGEVWMLNDVLGRPVYNWDSRRHIFRAEFDALHRPVKNFVRKDTHPEICTEMVVYGEGVVNDKQLNLRGRAYQHYDAAGVITNLLCDFKGNSLQSSRQLCSDYKNDIDWNVNPALEQTVYLSSAVFDAMNRPVLVTSPDQSIITPTFNEANMLDKVDVQIRGDSRKKTFVKNIDYDAKGQRQRIVYGNDTATSYEYDSKTFRLTQLSTTGKNGTDLLQKLQYTYDPTGNITSITDQAQQTIFFNNAVVDPSSEYVYDAVYRLITASGREHIGQNQPPSALDEFRAGLPLPGDGTALRNYTQSYEYDGVGNILQMIHAAGAGSWTRTYDYEVSSNRLKSNTVNNITESYVYDEHGNPETFSNVQGLVWDYKDQLQNIDLGGGGTAYYVYDRSGQRIRKVIERQGGIKEDRIYLGGVELYRKTDGAGNIQEETGTLHVVDDNRRIAMVETKTIKDGAASLEQLIRYQYSNQLGSSSLELDDNGTIISYEEYHPFGTTSYQSMNASIQAAAKRYRYTGMERDEESGLEYHSARYYMPWLGRWLNADPIGLKGGINLYAYCDNRVIIANDPSGTLIWFIVIATTVFLLCDDAQPANAPGYKVTRLSGAEAKEFLKFMDQEKARNLAKQPVIEVITPGKTYPRHSDADMLVKGGIMVITAGAGAGVTAFAEGVVGKGIIANTLGGAVFGATNAGGNLGYEDAKRGHLSSARDYAITVGTGAAFGGATAAVATAGGSLLQRFQKNQPRFRVRVTGENAPPVEPIPVEISDQPTAKIKFGTKESPYPPPDGSSLVLAISDTQGVAELAERTGSKVATQLEGQNLKGVNRITIKAHGDGNIVTIDGKNFTPERLAQKLIDLGFEGGEVRLIVCHSGQCINPGPLFVERLAAELEFLGAESGVAAPNGLGAVAPKGHPNTGLPLVSKPGVVEGPDGFLSYPQDFLAPGRGWVYR